MKRTPHNNDNDEAQAQLPNESSPLLSSIPLPNERPLPPHRTFSPTRTLALLYSITFILAFGGFLQAVPFLRILEQNLCHYYYHDLEGEAWRGFDDLIEEGDCKGRVVQERLNILLAGFGFGMCAVSLITTVPFGILADRIGRKIVFALSVLGITLCACYAFVVLYFWRVLPPELIWIGPIFNFIGGGEPVATMMFFAIGNDITSEANRANVFLFAGCGALLAGMIAPSLASTLMVKSHWLPILLGMGVLVIGNILLLFVPETLHLNPLSKTDDNISDRNATPSLKSKTSLYKQIKQKLHEGKARLQKTSKILHSLPTILLLTSFTIGPFNRAIGDLSTRYISNRYSWPLHQTGFLLSLQAFVNILLLTCILPLLSHILTTRLRQTHKTKDLLLSLGSIIILALGAALMGFAPTVDVGITGMVIWTLGTGFTALTRSLVTTLVGADQVASLYAAISLIETVSFMLAGPVLAALYAVGLQWRGCGRVYRILLLRVLVLLLRGR